LLPLLVEICGYDPGRVAEDVNRRVFGVGGLRVGGGLAGFDVGEFYDFERRKFFELQISLGV